MDEPEPFTLDRAWEWLSTAVLWLVSVCGSPAQIAARLMLVRRTRQHILQWLAPTEALARRIALLAALAAPKVNFAPPSKRSPRITTALRDRPLRALPENPAEWRAIFTLEPSHAGGPAKTDIAFPRASTRPPAYNALPLARRIEALMRLVRDPKRVIARMTRALAARGKALRARFGPYPHRGGPVHTHLATTQAALDAAFSNTS
jgi:hypothetical protein